MLSQFFLIWRRRRPRRICSENETSGWIFAGASAYRLISDLPAFIGRQQGHRVVAAGDLTIYHGYGEQRVYLVRGVTLAKDWPRLHGRLEKVARSFECW